MPTIYEVWAKYICQNAKFNTVRLYLFSANVLLQSIL